MEEKDKIIVKWVQENVEMSNNLLNKNYMFWPMLLWPSSGWIQFIREAI